MSDAVIIPVARAVTEHSITRLSPNPNNVIPNCWPVSMRLPVGFWGNAMDLKSLIRTIPDYPHEGILFRDITTLFADARGFRQTVDELVQPYAGQKIDAVAGIEARGFIMGGAVAHQLAVGFIPVRKKGKLPWETIGADYQLEYGTDRVEIHRDAVKPGERVLLVDDLIATGGTTLAGISLLREAGAEVVGCSFVIDLPELGGAAKLAELGIPFHALMQFEGT